MKEITKNDLITKLYHDKDFYFKSETLGSYNIGMYRYVSRGYVEYININERSAVRIQKTILNKVSKVEDHFNSLINPYNKYFIYDSVEEFERTLLLEELC